MVEKIITKLDTENDVKTVLEQISKANDIMHFDNEKVSPYNTPIPVKNMMRTWEEYCNMTDSSRDVYKDELRGLVRILNSWIGFFNEPEVEVFFTSGTNKGQKKVIKASVADALVKGGMCNYEIL